MDGQNEALKLSEFLQITGKVVSSDLDQSLRYNHLFIKAFDKHLST